MLKQSDICLILYKKWVNVYSSLRESLTGYHQEIIDKMLEELWKQYKHDKKMEPKWAKEECW